MEKGLCYGALGVSGLMLLIFLLDMFFSFPFGGSYFIAMDVFGVLASGIVGYLAYNTFRELK